MQLAILQSRAQKGVKAPLVAVETHISNGLPRFSIVGLPETAVKESKDRVRSALLNSHFFFPSRRITVNLAPADLPKEGGRFDLAIALGILAASNQLPQDELAKYEFAGELALSGELRPITGALPFALNSGKAGKTLIVPSANGLEASLCKNVRVLTAKHLLEVCAHLTGKSALSPHEQSDVKFDEFSYPDMADIYEQTHAKSALEIAAAGGHSVLLSGPPGTGKTMLASRLPGILPPMTEDEALDAAVVHSIRGASIDLANFWRRPFRNPHHSASMVALVGGGRPPKPGEISLAHNGVLFLDELPEFTRAVLEALREPLEAGSITIARAEHQAQYPAQFQLIAAMNPCPCGYFGHSRQDCRCTPDQIKRYQNKISGPLMDRIDLYVQVPALSHKAFTMHSQHNKKNNNQSSAQIRQRIQAARKLQQKRINKINCLYTRQDIEQYCQLDKLGQKFLLQAYERLALSPRAYHRILRVARTIADLAVEKNIQHEHVAQALSYRQIQQDLR